MNPWWTPFWSCPLCGREPQTRQGIGSRCASRLLPSPRGTSLYLYRGEMQRLVQVFRGENFAGAEAYLRLALSNCSEFLRLSQSADGIALAPTREHRLWGRNRLPNLIRKALPEARRKFFPDLFAKEPSRAQHALRFQERASGALFLQIRDRYQFFVQRKRWLVIDDIETTGTTLAQCQTALFDAGARQVDTFTLAVSLPDPATRLVRSEVAPESNQCR